MKIGAVIIFYLPDDKVINNFKQFDNIGIETCIVDNSPGKEASGFGVNYIYNRNQGGIAGALNRGCNFLFAKGCDYVFTFDQDSILPQDFFSSMLSFITEKKAEIVCPNFLDTNSNTYAAFIDLTKWRYKVRRVDRTAFAISSGMGISKNAWSQIGEFDERYIIDHVDTDFCLRAMDKKISIFVNYNICLEHQIGLRSVHKFLGVTLKPNNHNYKRKYYIVRNGTHLSFKYFWKYPSYFYMNILRVIHESVCVLLYEKSKSKKIYAIFEGLKDSVFERLGEIKH